MTDAAPAAHAWRPARFMVIVAHPDDADFGPAATAARWIDEGSEGWLVCCTSGDQGGEDPDADPLDLAALRETEQRRPPTSSATPGSTYLHQPDGALVNDLALREQLVREIRTFRPDAVFATDPETVFYRGGGINHTDHRAAGIAAVDAVYPAARNPMAFPWLARAGWPRIASAACTSSGRASRTPGSTSPGRSAARSTPCAPTRARSTTSRASTKRIRTWAAEEGEPIGTTAAEAFRVVVIDDDEDEGPG